MSRPCLHHHGWLVGTTWWHGWLWWRSTVWFATPVLCFHRFPLVVVVRSKDLELDVGLQRLRVFWEICGSARLSSLIQYWLRGRVSTTWPVVFHRPLFVRCIDTICPFKSGRSVLAMRLHCSMSRTLRRDRLFSRFQAAAIHSACSLYNVGWDGRKSRSRRWSNNWAGYKPMDVFRYCRTVLATLSLSKDPWAPELPIIILLAVSSDWW